MAGTGILTPAQESQLATMLDNLIKLNVFLEIIDGYVFKALITFLDNNVIDKLSVNIKTTLIELIDSILGNDLPVAEAKATLLVNSLKAVKADTSELLLVKGSVEIFAGACLNKINTLKGTEVKLKLI